MRIQIHNKGYWDLNYIGVIVIVILLVILSMSYISSYVSSGPYNPEKNTMIELIPRSIPRNEAKRIMEEYCLLWRNSSWMGETESLRGKWEYPIEKYAARADYILSVEEVRNGTLVGICDCGVFLYTQGIIDIEECSSLWSNKTACNSWALNRGCKESP